MLYQYPIPIKDIKKENLLDSLTLFDLRHDTDVYSDSSMMKLNKGNYFNLKCYLYDITDNLITCEIVPYIEADQKIHYNQKTMFLLRLSIQYLFELDDKNKVRRWVKKVIHNN